MLTTIVFGALNAERWRICRRALAQTAAVYFLRGCTLGLTILPAIDNFCLRDPTSNMVESVGDMFANIHRHSELCFGFVFSGHTATATVYAAVWVLYAKRLFLQLFGVTLYFATVFFISFDRLHYTVDIVLAQIIAILVIALHMTLVHIYQLINRHDCHDDRQYGRSRTLKIALFIVRFIDGDDLKQKHAQQMQPAPLRSVISSP